MFPDLLRGAGQIAGSVALVVLVGAAVAGLVAMAVIGIGRRK